MLIIIKFEGNILWGREDEDKTMIKLGYYFKTGFFGHL